MIDKAGQSTRVPVHGHEIGTKASATPARENARHRRAPSPLWIGALYRQRRAGHFNLDFMMQNMPHPSDADKCHIIGTVPVCRSELLRQVERWTYGRKIKLCTGLFTKIIAVSEIIRIHRLGQDEIDRWMDAYNRKDLEALKIGYGRKRRAA